MRLLKSIYRELDLTLALLHTVFSILLSLSLILTLPGRLLVHILYRLHISYCSLIFRHDTYNRKHYIPIINTQCLLNYCLFSHSWLQPMLSSSCSKRSCKPLDWIRESFQQVEETLAD